jgi:hypothetical protein
MRTDSPLDDLTYDVLTVLQNKAKALEAYDKYIRDADEDDEAREAFEEMKRTDQEHIRILKEVLARRLDDDLGFESDEDDFEDDEDDDEDFDDDDAAEDDDAVDAGPHRGEETVHVKNEPPPRRGESSHRS